MSAVNDLFNPSTIINWQTAYPVSDYQKQLPRAQKYYLHYLLALGQSQGVDKAFVVKYIDQQFEIKNPEKLFSKDEQVENITPLMIAVMQNNREIIEKLIEVARTWKCISDLLNAQDIFGWTPLHFAALVSEQLYDRLITRGANPKILNRQYGTAENVRTLTQRECFKFPKNVFVKNSEGKLTPLAKLTSRQIRDTLGILYRDIPFYPPSAYGQLRSAQVDGSYSINKIFDLYRNNPPAVVIQECQALQSVAKGAKEVVAKDDIVKGQPVGSYCGLYQNYLISRYAFSDASFHAYIEECSDEIAYGFYPFEAHEMGNFMRYSNCGFPNLVGIKIMVEGTEQFLFLSGGIKKNEPLLWSYGPEMSYLAYGKQVILGLDEMRKFFAPGFAHLISEDKKIWDSEEDTNPNSKMGLDKWIEAKMYHERLIFPLSAPSAILELHFNGIISASEWHRELLLKDNKSICRLVQDSYNRMCLLLCFLNSTIDFDRAITSSNAPKTRVCKWVLEKIGVLTMMQIMKLFDTYSEAVNVKGCVDWDEFILEEEKKIANYDWKQDPLAPITMKKAKHASLEFFKHLPKKNQIESLLNSYEALKDHIDYTNLSDKVELDFLAEQLFGCKDIETFVSKYETIRD